MAAGPVNRALLESFFQQPGQIYDDTKTESSFDVIADQIDDNYSQVALLINSGVLSPYLANMQAQAIINGNFEVWQRAGSWTNPTSGTYTADRYQSSFNADGGVLPTTITHSRQTLIAGELPSSFYYYRLGYNSAGSGFGVNAFAGLFQAIENATRYLCGTGKRVTVSFYARSSIAGKKLGIGLNQRYGTGGSPAINEALTATTPQIVTLTADFVKYTFTFNTNTISGKSFGTNNDDQLNLQIFSMWGSAFGSSILFGTGAESFGGSGNIDITQIQVCAGGAPLPFQPRSYSNELALCQRYYEASGVSTAIAIPTLGSEAATNIKFSVEKRIPPTMTIMAHDGTVGQISGSSGLKEGVGVVAYGSNLTTSGCGYLLATSGLTVGATRFCRWIADAEL